MVYILSVFSPLFGTGGGGSSSSLSSVFDESEKYDSLSLSVIGLFLCAYFENNIFNALILKTIKGMIVCMANIIISNDITKFNGFRVKTTFFIFRVATWNLLLGTLILH